MEPANSSVKGNESPNESQGLDAYATLGLPEVIIEKLRTVCKELLQNEVLRNGFKPPQGLILYGPPRTGKAQIARVIANESHRALIAVGPADIKAGFIGQSSQKVRELFRQARDKAPCVLSIDEFETVAAKRGSRGADQFTAEIVMEMLTQLDGLRRSERHVFLLASTNHIELVDEAVLSRFEDRIEIPFPGAQQRQQILQIILAKMPVDFDVAEFSSQLTGMTDNFSGRDLSLLVNRAQQKALQRAIKAGTGDLVILSREDLVSQLPAPQPKPSASSFPVTDGRAPGVSGGNGIWTAIMRLIWKNRD